MSSAFFIALAVLAALTGAYSQHTTLPRDLPLKSVSDMTDDEFRAQLLPLDTPNPDCAKFSHFEHGYNVNEPLPESYKYDDEYPECIMPTVDLKYCSAVNSLFVATTFAARRCIKGVDKVMTPLSVQYHISCDIHSLGCGGGPVPNTWDYMYKHGVPTAQCVSLKYTTMKGQSGECPNLCDDNSTLTFIKATSRPHNVGGNEENIMIELLKNGPVVALMDVYEDFREYHSGVYKHTSDYPIGKYVVEVMGYGVDEDTGEKYWDIRTNWGMFWGYYGMGKILRGVNECCIEDSMIAGNVE